MSRKINLKNLVICILSEEEITTWVRIVEGDGGDFAIPPLVIQFLFSSPLLVRLQVDNNTGYFKKT